MELRVRDNKETTIQRIPDKLFPRLQLLAIRVHIVPVLSTTALTITA